MIKNIQRSEHTETQTINTRSRIGQVLIEGCIGIVVLFMLLLAATRLFLWFNRCLIERHQRYEASRIDRHADGRQMDEDFYGDLPELNILGR